MYSSTSLCLKIFDNKNKFLGKLERGKGFNQIYTYTSKTTEKNSFKIVPKMSVKNPTLIVFENESEIMKAKGNFGAKNFNFIDTKNNKIFEVNKTIIPSSLKELFIGTDIFKISINYETKQSYHYDLLIAIAIVIDLSFHER